MLKNLGRVNPNNRGFQELFLLAGEKYIVISTVGNIGEGLDVAEKAIVDMAGVFAGTATSGQETLAFEADADGGKNSRNEVIEQLGGLEDES